MNEECGLIEWVDNLRTLREIIIKALRERGISPNVSLWGSYQNLCLALLTRAIVQRDQALFGRHLRRSIILKIALVHNQNIGQVCSKIALSLYSAILTGIRLPPVLHEWFIEMFPETEAWFTARLRYTRSSAVMSMVGYVLGYVISRFYYFKSRFTCSSVTLTLLTCLQSGRSTWREPLIRGRHRWHITC